jgi:NCAIR mutase (PurE)-related protein
MDHDTLRKLIQDLRAGRIEEEAALELLRKLPFSDLGHTKVDHHRALRQGAAEVVFAPGKTIPDLLAIIAELRGSTREVLISRVSEDQARAVLKKCPGSAHNAKGRTIRVAGKKAKGRGGSRSKPGAASVGPEVVILSAGTADAPVVEEARETLVWMQIEARVINDVGVAGIHRLLAHHDLVSRAAVIIVVAGMEGALASVVGGMVDKPVIGVPTSVGYGAGAGGIAALLGMLNSCASGVTVMNIDNGFGAACAAARILRLLPRGGS